jgi:hypothetical protein
MSSGEYNEKLPCGGTLIVFKSNWKIQYYFPGPDLRHNGTFVNLHGSDIAKYISAFIENWKEYEQLMEKIPNGGQFSKEGQMGMTIRIGGYHRGVCLKYDFMPITSREELKKVIDSYRYAVQRAPQIQSFLASL